MMTNREELIFIFNDQEAEDQFYKHILSKVEMDARMAILPETTCILVDGIRPDPTGKKSFVNCIDDSFILRDGETVEQNSARKMAALDDFKKNLSRFGPNL